MDPKEMEKETVQQRIQNNHPRSSLSYETRQLVRNRKKKKHDHSEKFNKEIEILKNKQNINFGAKDTITALKNSIEKYSRSDFCTSRRKNW